MEFEIFIKDNAFIPDIVDIKTNTTVIFRNEDSVQHTIHCNGCTNFVPLFVKAGKPERYVFSTRGKYLISDAGFGDMKVTYFSVFSSFMWFIILRANAMPSYYSA